jgi:hypothetical protein
MARHKIKTNHATEANGGPAASPGAATAAAGTDVPPSGPKLRWTSLKAADGMAQRTKKPKAKKPGTAKKETSTAKQDAVQPGKLSALDAAAKVLQEAGQPLNCQQLIQAMAAKGYWTSPAGKTPAATLYAAILRETKTKASQARFQKTSRGHFVYQSPPAP